MSKTWEEENTLLREDWNARHRCYELYFSVKFYYSTQKERDDAFYDFHNDEFMNLNMATPKKIDNNAIEVIKYVSVPEGKDKGEEINRWTDEMANRTGAYQSDIDISSYEEYRDTHFNLNEGYNRDYNIIEPKKLYDEVCRVLTDFEHNGEEETGGKVIPAEGFNNIFYDTLYKVQEFFLQEYFN